jgi:hypothetical protein
MFPIIQNIGSSSDAVLRFLLFFGGGATGLKSSHQSHHGSAPRPDPITVRVAFLASTV